jgi:UDP-N-acetylmuramate dehydrogenase
VNVEAAGVDAGTVALRNLTTFHLGGPARRSVIARTADELVAEVTRADAAGEPVLIVGGGSNLLIGDDGFDGVVVQVATRGIASESADYCGGAVVQVAAGEPWDDLVAEAVRNGWTGVEALSGIPGSTGATPVQNVGAYGQEVAATIASVRTFDRVAEKIVTLFAADCRFGYRDSRFKRERFRGGPRYVVLDVRFQFEASDYAQPVRYAELASSLGVAVGERVPLADVRAAVLALRSGKGMVVDETDFDTWSAGSFFTNPLLPADFPLPDGAPRYPAPDGLVKTSAAWLIQQAGFDRGYGLPGPASLSTKHTLALTNRGAATAADVLAVAARVRDGVRARFGVTLVPEPELVNCELP